MTSTSSLCIAAAMSPSPSYLKPRRLFGSSSGHQASKRERALLCLNGLVVLFTTACCLACVGRMPMEPRDGSKIVCVPVGLGRCDKQSSWTS